MRIGVDASALVAQPTGVGNYIRPILEHLIAHHGEVTWYLYGNQPLAFPSAANVRLRVSKPKLRGPAWQNTQLAAMIRADDLDVYWAANGLTPAFLPRRLAVVVTVHDLVYHFARETLPTLSYWGRRLGQPRAIARADRLITVSKATAQDVARINGRQADAIVHPLAHPRFSAVGPAGAAKARAAHNLPERYWLMTGTLEPRKNLATLLRAYMRCHEQGVALPLLALAGRKGWKDAQLEELAQAAEGRGLVRRLGYVADADLPGLYAGAQLFLLPSVYEGFGMPLLEAQLCGTTVAHGPHPAMVEAAGGQGTILHTDEDALVQDLTALATATPVATRDPADVHNDPASASATMWSMFQGALVNRRQGRAAAGQAPEQERAALAHGDGHGPVAATTTDHGRSVRGRKPRILMLTPRFPYPVIGGDRLRIYRIAKELAQDHEITLLSLVETRAELTAPVPKDGIFSRIERVYLPVWRSWLGAAMVVPSRTPLQVGYYFDLRFRALVRKLAPQHDAVFAHLLRTGSYIRSLPMPRFCEMTDAISLNYGRFSGTKATKGDRRGWIYRFERRRLEAYEKSVVADFDAAFFVAQRDSDHLFGANPPAQVIVSPNGVDVEEFAYSGPGDSNDIVMIANFSSAQNFEGAIAMARDVLPRVRQVVPTAQLRAVGRIPVDKAKILRCYPGVVVTGEVESVPAAARGGALAVAPLTVGAGMQNKVLEYMALGLPTVASTVAWEGTGAGDGLHLLVADGPEAISKAVLELLQDRRQGERIAQAARQFVTENYSWSVRLTPLREAVARVLAADS